MCRKREIHAKPLMNFGDVGCKRRKVLFLRSKHSTTSGTSNYRIDYWIGFSTTSNRDLLR